jgi:hypothetical protein
MVYVIANRGDLENLLEGAPWKEGAVSTILD